VTTPDHPGPSCRYKASGVVASTHLFIPSTTAHEPCRFTMQGNGYPVDSEGGESHQCDHWDRRTEYQGEEGRIVVVHDTRCASPATVALDWWGGELAGHYCATHAALRQCEDVEQGPFGLSQCLTVGDRTGPRGYELSQPQPAGTWRPVARVYCARCYEWHRDYELQARCDRCNQWATGRYVRQGGTERRVTCDQHVPENWIGGAVINPVDLSVEEGAKRVPIGYDSPAPWQGKDGRLFFRVGEDYAAFLLQLRITRWLSCQSEGATVREVTQYLHVTKEEAEQALAALQASGEVVSEERRGKRGPAKQVWKAAA
jgi:hypothetical protein